MYGGGKRRSDFEPFYYMGSQGVLGLANPYSKILLLLF